MIINISIFEPYCDICQDILLFFFDRPSGTVGICRISNRINYHIFKWLYGILKNAEQKKLPFNPIFDILLSRARGGKGEKMTRQVQNRQGRIINPLHTILFVSALLVFIFTVVYRMARSENFSTAMATLVESLLIVSFFIFFGLFIAYLFYFIHERIRQGSRHRQLWDMFIDPSGRNAIAGKSHTDSLGLEQNDEVGPGSNSWYNFSSL